MENNKQLTAVEWLVSQLNKQGFAEVVTDEEIQQAKTMEKEQIINARVTAPILPTPDSEVYKIEAEHYYTETYGREKGNK